MKEKEVVFFFKNFYRIFYCLLYSIDGSRNSIYILEKTKKYIKYYYIPHSEIFGAFTTFIAMTTYMEIKKGQKKVLCIEKVYRQDS